MIKTLITALQKIEIDPTAEELADALWLTRHVRPSAKKKAVQKELPLPADKPVEPLQSSPETTPPQPEMPKQAPLYARTEKHAASSSVPVYPFRTPAVPMLSDSLRLGRALRPLMRRTNSRTRFVLDEAATVERIAEERIWVPVLKGANERWFDAVLVIEQSGSMVIWQPVIDEFRIFLERHGAFRDVRIWQMITDRETGKIRLCKGSAYSRERNPREILDPSARRLIFVVSDCVSTAWRNREAANLIECWGKYHPTVIVQMLPRRLWRGTGLGDGIQMNVQAVIPGSPNTGLIHDPADLWLDEEDLSGIKTPIITLEPESVTEWAEMISAKHGVKVPGVLFEKELDEEAGKVPVSGKSESSISALERVQQFIGTASPDAQKLAGYLGAAPLTLPVMRLVQQVMLPESRQVHLAEVFLGGLLKRAGIPPPLRKGGNEEEHPNRMLYDFHEGVRELLLDSILTTDALHVLKAVSGFLEKRMGQSLDFQAWLADPTGGHETGMTEENRPFAHIAAKVLRRFGGDYAKLADRLEGQQEIEIISEEIPQRFTNTLGMEFVYIPPGEFMMGSPKDEPGRDDDEKQHHVTLTKGFYMQTTQVTVGQWKQFIAENPNYKGDGENRWRCKGMGEVEDFSQEDTHPVACVSWNETQAFINWLNQKEKTDRYRLPTEAEWEYACRAGTTTPFFFGECLSTDQANYDGNYPLKGCPKGEYREKTTPVASFPPNDWGLFDMHGNVWDWCQDWFANYSSDAVADPVGPGSGSNRVLRGGSWDDLAWVCRSANRYRHSPDSRNNNLGFRLVLPAGQPGK